MTTLRLVGDIQKELTVLIGSRIRARREYMGRTQSDIARLLRKKQNSISMVESGTNNITASELAIVAEYLRAPIEYFFGEIEGSEIDLDIAVIERIYKAITPEQRVVIMTMFKAMG